MTTRFERQLEELHVQIITMGSLCEKVIAFSAKAIQGVNQWYLGKQEQHLIKFYAK